MSGDPVIEPDTCEATAADPGYRMLFDGTAESLEDWNMAGPGLYTREPDCTIKGNGGMGLLWHSEPLEGDYSLQLDWKLVKDDNGGVFIGFPNPGDDPWVITVGATDDANALRIVESIAGVDIAIWDVKAQALGIPLYQALGGSLRGVGAAGDRKA